MKIIFFYLFISFLLSKECFKKKNGFYCINNNKFIWCYGEENGFLMNSFEHFAPSFCLFLFLENSKTKKKKSEKNWFMEGRVSESMKTACHVSIQIIMKTKFRSRRFSETKSIVF